MANSSSGFNSTTSTFQSLLPPVELPSPSTPLSVTSFILSSLPSPLPTTPAFIHSNSSTALLFPQLISQINNLTASLHHNSLVSKGDVAFILSPNRLQLPPLFLSLLSLGAIISPANPFSTPSEISRLIELSKPSIAFTTSNFAHKLPPQLTTILIDSPTFHSFLNENTNTSFTPPEILQPDVAAILYSSGTTGSVKAAALSHRNLTANTALVKARGIESGDSEMTLLGAPMFHTMGLMSMIRGVVVGLSTVIMEQGGGVMDMLRVVEKYKVNRMSASPPIVVAMARSKEVERMDLGALRTVVCGGASLPETVVVEFRKRFPKIELWQGYGLTELGAVSIRNCNEESLRIGSVGRIAGYVEAKIVDSVTGKALSVGEIGELWLRSPTMMIGYFGDKEANASSFDSNGWLRTGDLCYFDNYGYLYIVGRLKEIIKYKAYQVAPNELEELLNSLLGVAEVAVIPYPVEEVGEIPMACIVQQPGSNLSEETVINHVAKQVAPYKKIRKVVFVKSIPKSPAGKILRHELYNATISKSKSKL